jgi:hypothetical protein
MSRERRRGLLWAGGSVPRPRAEMFSAAGTGPGQPPRQRKSARANDRAGYDWRGGRRKGIRQVLRGVQHASQPGMVRCRGSTGGSMEGKGSVGV